MGLFGRKSKGRHALGAAVTSIPSAPLQAPAAVVAPPAPWDAPVAAAPPLPAAPAAPVAAAPEPTTEPDLLTSISELLVTGEAWAPAVPPSPMPVEATAAPAAVLPAGLPVPEQSRREVLDVPPPAAPQLVAPTAPVVMPSPRELPAVPAVPAGSARSSLDAALAELLPLQQDESRYDLPVQALPPVPTPHPLPPVPITPAQPPSVPVAPATPLPSVAPVAAVVAAPEAPPAAAPEPAVAPASAPVPASRVQLGFRDGSSAALTPGSSQYSELEQLARSLTSRD